MSPPRTERTVCSLCLKEEESPEFFQVQEPTRYRGGELSIFPSPSRAYMEKRIKTVTSRKSLRLVLRRQAVFLRRRRTRAYIEGTCEEMWGPRERREDEGLLQVIQEYFR